MKILMYSVRPDEKPAIDAWAHRNHAQVDTTPLPFVDNIELATGYDDISILQHARIDDFSVYERLAALGIKHISLRITGYNTINFAAADANDIIVTNVPAYSPRSVAEAALMHTMVLLRQLENTEARMRHHDYSWDGLQAREIHNLTVGIFGTGKIGGTAARIFKALGARVIANDLAPRTDLTDTVEYVDFATLLAESDVLTIHTNLDATTHHLFNGPTLAKMKNSAFLINCARGPIVETPALIDALQNGVIAGAGLDAIECEELFVEHDLTNNQELDFSVYDQLLAMPNVSLTPHIGFYTDAAVQNMIDIALDDVALIIQGQLSPHIVHD
ncbi:D-2-hydroxyacid dehydrogenase [Periweissella ghanensis]|uniref:D-lactate/D-glycerate dehydrogenase n=1 Tax=Periweissella ghanensis TaxID=467997 RepID=A0ABM8ZBI6_9LACO|nr:D-lactate/D-glycerate dehydrogenase [Periweissella ghanensis]